MKKIIAILTIIISICIVNYAIGQEPPLKHPQTRPQTRTVTPQVILYPAPYFPFRWTRPPVVDIRYIDPNTGQWRVTRTPLYRYPPYYGYRIYRPAPYPIHRPQTRFNYPY